MILLSRGNRTISRLKEWYKRVCDDGIGCTRYSASFDDIKNKYKIMIKLFHPDRHTSDDRVRKYAENKTKELNNALNRLKIFKGA